MQQLASEASDSAESSGAEGADDGGGGGYSSDLSTPRSVTSKATAGSAASKKTAEVHSAIAKALEDRMVKKHAQAMADIAKLKDVIEEQKAQGTATAITMARLEAALQSHMKTAETLANPDTVLGRSIAAQSEAYLAGIERVVQSFQTTRSADRAQSEAERAAREARDHSMIMSLSQTAERERAANQTA